MITVKELAKKLSLEIVSGEKYKYFSRGCLYRRFTELGYGSYGAAGCLDHNSNKY